MTIKEITYKTTGVCSQYIKITIDETEDNKERNIIKSVIFMGGCPGNATGIAKAIEGSQVGIVADLFKGIKCGSKDTSCPDQLSKALEEYLK